MPRRPGVTAGAEIARLAGEGEQKFVGAGVAENSGEAVLEEPTGQKLADDLGDDRAPVAVGGSEALVPDEAQLAKPPVDSARLRSRPPSCVPRCGGEMRVVGFITEPAVIKRILDHLRKREQVSRPPPRAPQPVASTA